MSRVPLTEKHVRLAAISSEVLINAHASFARVGHNDETPRITPERFVV